MTPESLLIDLSPVLASQFSTSDLHPSKLLFLETNPAVYEVFFICLYSLFTFLVLETLNKFKKNHHAVEMYSPPKPKYLLKHEKMYNWQRINLSIYFPAHSSNRCGQVVSGVSSI